MKTVMDDRILSKHGNYDGVRSMRRRLRQMCAIIVPGTKAGRKPTWRLRAMCSMSLFHIDMFYLKIKKKLLIWPNRWSGTCPYKKIDSRLKPHWRYKTTKSINGNTRTRITRFIYNYLKCNFDANCARFVLLRNFIKLIAMVSLCYKREKRIESQLSKLITAKPIYSDRVISCLARFSSAEFALKLFSAKMLKII